MAIVVGYSWKWKKGQSFMSSGFYFEFTRGDKQMLRHIYKNQMIQAFRKVGYSKKQAKQIYDKFEGELIAQNDCLSRIKYSVIEGKCSFKFSGAFVWTHTKQGHKYWAEIHYKLHKKGI